jgi:hypothetical protein
MRPEAVVGYMGLACVTVGMFAGSAEALFVGAGCMGLPAVMRAGSGVRRAGTTDALPDGVARAREQYVAGEIGADEFERRLDLCFGLVEELPPFPAGVIKMVGGLPPADWQPCVRTPILGEGVAYLPLPTTEGLEQ